METSLLMPISQITVASFKDSSEENCHISLATFRQNTLEISTYFKLSSVWVIDNAVDAFVIDRLENEFRFTVVYQLQSTIFNYSLRLITKSKDGFALISLQSVFPAFNWAEREIWDLSGVFFIKHPDLRRILSDYGFSGHPLRKDFPVSGFKEVHYDDSIKQITYSPIELSQSFRLWNISKVWINAETF